jgi:dienelactone hydrolase
LQARYRPLPAVREFLKRGYAVVVPMRQGFSNSGGKAVGEGCNIAANGSAQAEDVRAVVSWIEKQPWADAQHMVMLGQSHGGLTTLAYARDPHPGFKLFVNFAGGLKYNSDTCQWELALKSAYADYGAETKVPTLWFYGANDSFFPPAVISPAHAAYVAAGGSAEMVAYEAFEGDAHGMFGSPRGLRIWWPLVQARLVALGLPTEVTYPVFADAGRIPVPPPLRGARIDDLAKLPHLNESGPKGYRQFLTKAPPRAFAVGPEGHWAWSEGADDSPRRAQETCQTKANAPCRLYAVDNDVVWSEP